MILSYRPAAFCFTAGLVMLTGAQGCRRAENQAGHEPDRHADQPKPKSVLVFPDAIKVPDDSVNQALRHAMAVSMSGDYDTFRLLWTAREDPLPRGEFEKGFGAVEEIRIEALEKVMLAGGEQTSSVWDTGGNATANPKTTGEAVYAAYATIRLDPTENLGQLEPERQVVLMLVHEHDDWRLAHAPKKMRAWLKDKVKVALGEQAAAADQPEAAKSP